MLRKLVAQKDIEIFGEYKLELIKFHQEWAKKLGLFDKVVDKYTYDRAIKHINEDGYFQFLINHENEDIGIVEYKLEHSEIDSKKIIYVSCLYIKEKYRGLGFGKSIINELKKQNMRIELECWYEMPANNMYKSMGMKEIKTRYMFD